ALQTFLQLLRLINTSNVALQPFNNNTKIIKQMKNLILPILLIFILPVALSAQNMTLGNPWINLNNTDVQYGRDNQLFLRNADVSERLFDFESTYFALENAVAQNPQSADALLRRANFKKKAGMLTEAAADARLARIINPYAADLFGYNGQYAILNIISNKPETSFVGLTMNQKMRYYYSAMDSKYMDDTAVDAEMNALDAAILEIEAESFGTAIDILDELIVKYPNSAVAYDMKGMLLAHLKEYDAALIALNKAITLEPEFAIAWYNLGRVEKEIGHQDQAGIYFNRAIALQNNLTKARFGRASILKAKGQNDAAIREYDEIIEMRGGNYLEAYLNRGLLRKMTGNFSGALEDLNRVIKAAPTNAEIYKNRGNLFLLYGYHIHAIADYTKAIDLEGEYAEAYFNRGLAQFLIYDKASGCYDLEQAEKYGYKRAIEKKKYFCVD
ncbi:MAG: tetratricopeptide (TPR) repeat protein, partial [Saprospiraceae bacterium]